MLKKDSIFKITFSDTETRRLCNLHLYVIQPLFYRELFGSEKQ